MGNGLSGVLEKERHFSRAGSWFGKKQRLIPELSPKPRLCLFLRFLSAVCGEKTSFPCPAIFLWTEFVSQSCLSCVSALRE